MTGDLVKAYPFLSDAEAQRFGTGKEEIGKCPRCGFPVYVGKGNFYCSNKDCSFCLWEDNKFFSSKKKKLTKKIAKELLDKGWCRVTGLYTPKKPQLYDAVIQLDDSVANTSASRWSLTDESPEVCCLLQRRQRQRGNAPAGCTAQ